MILIGMFDSPFVRRVAVSMKLLDIPFQHRDWSVGRDQFQIRQFNPLGRVPTLVLDNEEALIESGAILDHLDYLAAPDQALTPRNGVLRRRCLRLMAMATGAAEKGVAQVYEIAFRPPERRHAPWVARCREQMDGALAALEQECAELRSGEWLLGRRLSQADVTAACVYTFLADTQALAADRTPKLAALTARCEALPEFAATRLPFFTPAPAA